MIGINSYLSSLKSNVKSVQRGTYVGAGGTITITAVNVNKSIILSKSKSSSGYVAATGSITGTLYPDSQSNYVSAPSGGSAGGNASSFPSYSGTRTISGGSTSLTTKQFSAVLTNSTTITCDGPVEWQVIEYV